jgi:leucyl/phenylalanyl-tRNA---protein transferase
MPATPVEPSPTTWAIPPATAADTSGLVGVGADLEPGTMLAAYRAGVFPMPLSRHGPVGWWSPDPRGVIPLDRLHVSRSLRRSCRSFEVRVDTAFAQVVRHCADPRRPHGWITPGMREAYRRLYELGWAHSVETYRDGVLVGGVFGVAVGGLFAGESMFHLARDASKAALVALVERLRDEWAAQRLLDVQWTTPHLSSLGAVDLSRLEYLARLERALRLPPPPFSR